MQSEMSYLEHFSEEKLSMTQLKGSAVSSVLIWVDRPTRLGITWFGFLAFVICMSLSESPFLYDIMGDTTSSLRFLWDSELLEGIVLWSARLGFFCLVSLE